MGEAFALKYLLQQPCPRLFRPKGALCYSCQIRESFYQRVINASAHGDGIYRITEEIRGKTGEHRDRRMGSDLSICKELQIRQQSHDPVTKPPPNTFVFTLCDFQLWQRGFFAIQKYDAAVQTGIVALQILL